MKFRGFFLPHADFLAPPAARARGLPFRTAFHPHCHTRTGLTYPHPWLPPSMIYGSVTAQSTSCMLGCRRAWGTCDMTQIMSVGWVSWGRHLLPHRLLEACAAIACNSPRGWHCVTFARVAIAFYLVHVRELFACHKFQSRARYAFRCDMSVIISHDQGKAET